VKLVALFAPEHGPLRHGGSGQASARWVDHAPVCRSIRSTAKSASQPGDAQGIDALVIDLQDIGVRSYTYVSAMRYALEGCFENNVEAIVLDRPNPLGGLIVNGRPWMPTCSAMSWPSASPTSTG